MSDDETQSVRTITEASETRTAGLRLVDPVGPTADLSTNAGTPPTRGLVDEHGRRVRRTHIDQTTSDRVDRFKLERKLGAGGMGTVYEATDDRLQRRVALKFLRSGFDTPRGERRFVREAQGLARISHPNVIAVYDVGRWNGRVWIAMEYVPGHTLGDWVRAAKRTQAEILAHWLAAGAGLAAIHDADMIHRDVKPANVLLGDDGRVRIVDFGLVKALTPLSGSTTGHDFASDTDLATPDSGLDQALTEPQGFVGTPAYAAPECLERQDATTRSDQYSFAVSLWESLCGERPPRKDRTAGELVPLPEGVRLPRRVHVALSRALSQRARDRFLDMHSLLAALAPPRRRWLAPTLAAAATAMLVGGVAAAFTPTAAPMVAAEEPCLEASAPIDELWTADRRASLLAHFDVTAAEQAASMVDEWVGRWSSAAQTSCEDVHVRQRYSEQALDRRTACLARALDGFEAMAMGIDDGRVSTATELIGWFEAMPDPGACLAETVLQEGYEATPAEHEQEVAGLRRRLFEVAKGKLQRRDQILVVENVLARAEALDHESLQVDALILLGSLHIATYDSPAARRVLGRAIDLTTAAHDHERAAAAWSILQELENKTERNLERVQWTLERQAALFEDVEPSPRARGRLLRDRALYLSMDSQYEPAEQALRDALALFESIGVSGSWDRATTLRTLGWLLSLQGRAAEALEAHAAARTLELVTVDDHGGPIALARATSTLGESIALIGAGELEKARVRALVGLDQAIEEQGARGELVARYHIVIAAACDGLGQLDCVREHSELADSISAAALGPNGTLRIDVLSTVGVVALRDQRPEAAVVAFEQALALARRNTGDDSVTVGLAQINLADALRKAGQIERAVELGNRALQTLERKLAPEDPELVRVHIWLAEPAIERSDCRTALAHLDRAAQMVDVSDMASQRQIRDLRARCSAATPIDHKR
jgi:tRNA A-37 threonylcarbamoyl transferase component Bud32/tetratricopeptide (TPR) repeat protein